MASYNSLYGDVDISGGHGFQPGRIYCEDPRYLRRATAHCRHAHQGEIHQDIENEEKLVAELKATMGPSKIHERLAELNAADDPLPPG